jgi:hypothetical protein
MTIDTAAVRAHLKDADIKTLFVEELGWNIHRGRPVEVTVDGGAFTLTPIVEKHGVQVFECAPGFDGAIPDRLVRQKIDRQVTKVAHEHLVVFLNDARTQQLWQWVAREPGRPTAFREHRYWRGQAADALIQKLDRISIPISEEDAISITGVTQKLKDAFDKDKVTKKFYERFKTEHARFLKLISGIDDVSDREWYASLMLNRLMFVYFIEKKGFLDGDSNYLRNRLARMQQKWKDKFHTFYRHFLLRLFHEGLGRQPPRPSELDDLLGDVPYLNGGLFDVHELEAENPNIEIPDKAFEALFEFFDAYEWHLDYRPLRTGKEINPDVLGYIFEKYVNQKQMGAYYTKEDITEYIAKNTIIPFLFDAAEKECAIAFQPDSALWRLLRDDPDRYIYAAVRKGVDGALPNEIAAGIDDVSKRTGWNRPADAEFALPTETWREHVTRRQRCLELRAKLKAGQITSINDLITYNLDIRQFAQDVIEQSEGPELVRAFFSAIKGITVLDPAVGSGAFLFAALNILRPLYDACLDRMQAFIDDLKETGKDDPGRYADFRDILARVAEHPNREYYVLKSIIINNLYGVDIMEEAVEICKLRLFLKLVAQIDRAEEVEPLPDMDFNIRAGNTLVGFTSLEAVRQAMTLMPNGQHRMLSAEDEAALAQIEENAAFADEAFQAFHRMQAGEDIDEESFAAGKAKVREWLDYLRDNLDRHLAREYGIDADNEEAFERWRASHQPFHWFVEFYGIMKRGGFDAIIGNPPYVEYRKVKETYTVPAAAFISEGANNLYGYFLERASLLVGENRRVGMIVPVGFLGLDEAASVRAILLSRLSVAHFSSYAIRPAKLFEGVDQRLCILVGRRGDDPGGVWTTRYHHWSADERAALFGLLTYSPSFIVKTLGRICQLGEAWGASVIQKLTSRKELVEHYYTKSKSSAMLHYHRSPRYWIRSLDFEPYFRSETRSRSVYHFRDLLISSAELAPVIGSALNSSLFFYWFTSVGNGRNITGPDVGKFPIGRPSKDTEVSLSSLFQKLMKDYKKHAIRRVRKDCEFDEFRPSRSKPVLDEIDLVLARHYGFGDEELDFIINYDIKYRVGADEGGQDEE